MIDIRKGVIVSRTNLIDSKKETALPWKGVILVLFITSLIAGSAYFYNVTEKKKLSSLQSNLNVLKQNRDYEKIAEVSDHESRLQSIDDLLTERINWDKLFKKIEDNTIPDVTFSSMDAKEIDETQQNNFLNQSATQKKFQVEFKGSTIGLNNLSKQILAFQGNKDLETEYFADNVKIIKIDIKKTDSGDIDQGGAIDFTIQVDVNPKIMKSDYKNTN